MEKNEHAALCEYIKLQYPNVIFNTDLSGIKLTIGQAKQAKKLRSSRGFPDIPIYEARGGFHGLFIELKKTGVKVFKKDGTILSNEHMKEQSEVLKKLREKGYFAEFAIGFDQGKRMIDNYMNLETSNLNKPPF